MSLGLTRPCQRSATASKTMSTTLSHAQSASASGARNMMAATLEMPSVAVKRTWSPVRPTQERSAMVTPVAASSGTRLPWPKGSRARDLLDGLDGELAQVHRRGDLARVLEGLLRELGQHLVEALAQRRQVCRGQRDAHRARVPAEARGEVGAPLDGLKQVDRAHRASRAACDVALDGEKQRGHVVAVDDAARHDTLDTLVPALAAHDDDAAARIRLAHAGERILGERGLDVAALLVDGLELRGEPPGLHGVALEQQVEREGGVGHAPGGVEARMSENERPSAVMVARSARASAASAMKPGRAVARMCAMPSATSARFSGRERHHIRHGAERRHLGQTAPEIGGAAALSQRLHELERHAGTGELARGALGRELGVGQGHAPGHHVGGLMVVGHHEVDAARREVGNLVAGGDAVVHRHDDVGRAGGDDAVERGLGESVALVEAMRDKRGDVTAERPQGLGKQAGRGDAVYVEIAEDRDCLVRVERAVEARDDLVHTRDDKRSARLSAQSRSSEGGEEAPSLPRRRRYRAPP